MINTLAHAVRPLHRGQMQPARPSVPTIAGGQAGAVDGGTEERREGEIMSCAYRSLRSPVGAKSELVGTE